MSWLRSAVNKAVEVGGNSNLTRTVRNYADSVVQQAGHAVAEGAKIFQDRIAARNIKSFKHAIKRLEEVSVSCTGIERVQLLRRWLVALKEVERISADSVEGSGKNAEQLHTPDESKDSLRRPTLALYYDADLGLEPMNFFHVFLHSQALEGMILSVILEAPNDEEVSLLLEIFGLCLTGGKEVHNATMSSIQDLAEAFSSYKEEVLVKREELLQYAQGAIEGLKINADIARIDSEVSDIHKKLDGMKPQKLSSEVHISSEETLVGSEEAVKEAFAQVQLCSRLEPLLLKKKLLNNADSLEIHVQKVDKLKILSESLANSASKAEKRLSDHRKQKEEALSFRVTKTSEVSQTEKELIAEIGKLEKQGDELEAELRKVNTSLAAARARLHNTKEEREQFDVASNQILTLFNTKEDELSRSIACYRTEADVCNAFVNFLEGTRVFQSSNTEQKEKLINDELGRYGDYFVNLAVHLLSAYKDSLGSSITSFRELVQNLNSIERSELAARMDDKNSHALNPRTSLEEEYLDSEAKFVSTLSVVESIKKQFPQNEEISRHIDQRVKDLLDDLEKIKEEFESIERPELEIESPTRKAQMVSKEGPQRSASPMSKLNQKAEFGSIERSVLETETPNRSTETPSKESSECSPRGLKKASNDKVESSEGSKVVVETPSKGSPQIIPSPTTKQSPIADAESIERPKNTSDPEVQLMILKLELEEESKEDTEEIGGWEFDELEKELKSSDMPRK